MRAVDKNSDGLIQENELDDSPFKQRFSQVDRDKNGTLTRDEYEYYRKLFDAARNVVIAIRPGGKGDVTDLARRLGTDAGSCRSAPRRCSTTAGCSRSRMAAFFRRSTPRRASRRSKPDLSHGRLLQLTRGRRRQALPHQRQGKLTVAPRRGALGGARDGRIRRRGLCHAGHRRRPDLSADGGPLVLLRSFRHGNRRGCLNRPLAPRKSNSRWRGTPLPRAALGKRNRARETILAFEQKVENRLPKSSSRPSTNRGSVAHVENLSQCLTCEHYILHRHAAFVGQVVQQVVQKRRASRPIGVVSAAMR